MEFSSLPITEFYNHCLDGAKSKGYKWVISLVARADDVTDLYHNLKHSWYSLDSITGQYFLFVFAGKENITFEEQSRSKITDYFAKYQAVYNRFVSILNPNANIKHYVHYDWRHDKEGYLQYVSETQTDAINSLKRFFHLSEEDIPCLVFTSLYDNERYIVPIAKTSNDLYGYFKKIFIQIDPLLETLKELESKEVILCQQEDSLGSQFKNLSLTLEDKLVLLYNELIEWAESNDDTDLVWCVENRKYKKYPQPIRGTLNKYIDISKEYERKKHLVFNYEDIKDTVSGNYVQKQRLAKELALTKQELIDTKKCINHTIGRINDVIKGSIVMEQKRNDPINISVTGGRPQINIAKDFGKIDAEQNIYVNYDNVEKMLTDIRNNIPEDADPEDISTIKDSLQIIEDEVKSSQKHPGILRLAVKTLQGIKGTVEFMAAVSTLAAFVQTIG